jgi:RHS repeat-associated protein
MKKLLILTLLVFPILCIGQTNTENFVKTTSYQINTQTGNVDENQKIEGITYYDGLGRPIQTVSVNAGGEKQNIIQHIEYDGLGRTSKDYLPYSTPDQVITDPLLYTDPSELKTNIYNFYNTDKYEYTPNPFSQTVYENSPQSRPLNQGAPGSSWAINPDIGDEHTIKTVYQTNNGHSQIGINDEVIEYNVTFSGNNNPILVMEGYYKTGTLLKTIIKDENWTYETRWFQVPNSSLGYTKEIQDHTVEEYINKEGQVVLKRTFNNDIPHDTYYVYDDYGNLSFVLPPELSAQVASQYPNPNLATTYSASWAFSDFASPQTQGGQPYEGDLNINIIGNNLILEIPNQADSGKRFFLHQNTTKPLNTGFEIEDTVLGEITGKIHLDVIGGGTERPIATISITNGNLEINRFETLQVNYNEFEGNISAVIPIVNSETIPEFEPVSFANDFLNELGYQYRYDYRNRLIEKKIPAKGWEYIVYNLLDQPILIQDANQRSKSPKEWLFTKYDPFGRVAYTGIKRANIGRATFQSIANNSDGEQQYETMSSNPETIEGTEVYYTNTSTPSVFESGDQILTVNYYSDYVDLGGYTLPDYVYGQAITSQTQSLSTVSKVRVLDTDDWITTVTGYDDKARPIYAASINTYLDTEDTSESRLDFIGKVLESRTTHQKTGHQAVVTKGYFTYDHQNRLITHMQQIDNEPVQLIASNTYDELGQLESKRVGGQLFESGYTDLVKVSVSDDGSVITKTDPNNVNSYNAGLATIGKLEGNGGISFSVESIGSELRVGFNDVNENAGVYDINYFYRFLTTLVNGKYRYIIYKRPLAGGGAQPLYTGYYDTDSNDFKIERDGDTLHFIQNGAVIISTQLEDPSIALIGDISFRTPNSQISNLNFYATNIDKSLQKVDYEYNVRGWLTDINDVDAQTKGSKLFNFHINYDTKEGMDATGSIKPLYNGNISQTMWRSANSDSQTRAYGYAYDALNRINSGFSRKGTNYNTVDSYTLFDVSYDKNGNIGTLKRYGDVPNVSPQLMDDLQYHYVGNQLQNVTDISASTSVTTISQEGFYDGNTSGNDYSYDVNGNMIGDKNKGITSIEYNHLNLPIEIKINATDNQGDVQNGTITYIYDATGIKLAKMTQDEIQQSIITTSYASGYIYENNNGYEELKMFPHSEGYVEPVYGTSKSIGKFNTQTQTSSFSNYQYIFNYTDHIGNVRLSYSDSDGDGAIKPSTEIISEKHYYPFGLQQKGYNNVITSNSNSMAEKFSYNSKENNSEFGLGWYDYGARNYDPTIGRWVNPDPLAEMSFNLTPYRFAGNNPVLFQDPNGLWEFAFDEESGTLSLNRQEGDTYDSFLEQSGLSGSQAKKLFGVSKKDLQGKLNKGGGDSFAVSDFNSKSKHGKLLQGLETALSSGNEELRGLPATPDTDENTKSNCFTCTRNLMEDGSVDSQPFVYFDPRGTATGYGFDNELNDERYSNPKKPKLGDGVRWAKGGKAEHASVFLLNNNDGVQMFTKNGHANSQLYRIMLKTDIIKAYGKDYGIPQGRQKYEAQVPTADGGTKTEIRSDSSEYYRYNN